jgi:hypothetical protein
MFLLILLFASRFLKHVLGRDWSANAATFDTLVNVPGLRIAAAVEGLLLVLVSVAALLQHGRRRAGDRFGRIVFAYSALGVTGAALGFFRGNDVVYLAGDAYQMFGFALAYFATSRIVRSRSAILSAERWFVGLNAAYMLYELATVALSGDILKVRFGTFSFFMVIMFVLPRLFAPGGKSRIAQGLFAFAYVDLILSFARSTMIITAAILGLYFLTSFRKLRIPIGVIVAIAAGTAYLTYQSSQLRYQGQGLSSALSAHFDEVTGPDIGRSNSVVFRLDEATAIVRETLATSPILGHGLGGVLNLRADRLTGRGRHYIHITIAAIILRLGLVGLLVHLAFLISLNWRGVTSLRPLSRDRLSQIFGGSVLFLLVVTINSQIDSSMFLGWSPTIGFVLGLQTAILRRWKREDAMVPLLPVVETDPDRAQSKLPQPLTAYVERPGIATPGQEGLALQ